jgi:hypothetical protein
MPRKLKQAKETKAHYRAKGKTTMADKEEPTAVALRPALAEQLRAEAARRQTSIEALANDWLEDQLWDARRGKIMEEAERYRAAHAQLRRKYADKIIALWNGQVVDSGDDFMEVYQRIRERFGDEAVLITQVSEEPIETFTIRSPCLAEQLYA